MTDPIDPMGESWRDEPACVDGEADDRVEIRMDTKLHAVVDEAAALLEKDSEIYQRDGHLVRVVRVAETDEDSRLLAGTPIIRRVETATLRERLTKHARFQKFDGRSKEWKNSLPSDPVVGALAARGAWKGVRALVGMTEAPLFRADGSLLETPGFDPSTGYLYVPSGDFPPVKPCPTQADAAAALADLSEVFCDFPFRSKADRMVPIAAVLTLLARPALGSANVPAIGIESNIKGSGKGKATDCACIIATGRAAAKGTYPTDDSKELEKVLAAYALQGAAAVTFDNVDGSFGGGPLDKVLTCGGRVALRILGKSEAPEQHWRAVVLFTGNNIAIVGDTSRRALLARIEHPYEKPEDIPEGSYRHHPLEPWVLEQRPRLVCAALTILRAWHVADRPRMGCASWGSFEQWAATIPPAIVYAGGADPMACRIGDANDPERTALLVLLRDWPRLGALTARDAIDALYPRSRLMGEATPDSYAELREAIEIFAPAASGKAPSPHKLGNALRRFRGRVVGGLKLMSSPGRSAHWRVVEARVQAETEDGAGNE